jgi:hypothetical protein
METISQHVSSGQEKTFIEEVGSGSVIEGIGGAGALVLSILGLVGVLPSVLASIAAIGIGGALLIGGGTMAARYSRLLARTQTGYVKDIIGSGMAAESLCGVAGIVLGILSLLNVGSLVLLPIASIVFGGALLMAGGAMSKLSALPIGGTSPQNHLMVCDAMQAASSSETLIGVTAIVLGILALSGMNPLQLMLISFLAVGTSVLLSGASMAGRFFSVFSH